MGFAGSDQLQLLDDVQRSRLAGEEIVVSLGVRAALNQSQSRQPLAQSVYRSHRAQETT
jgi:hypothetical protein